MLYYLNEGRNFCTEGYDGWISNGLIRRGVILSFNENLMVKHIPLSLIVRVMPCRFLKMSYLNRVCRRIQDKPHGAGNAYAPYGLIV